MSRADPDVIDVQIPHEPPTGTVIVDPIGMAWQRIAVGSNRDRWAAPARDQAATVMLLTWGEMVARGRLEVVWRPIP